jgi:hypothetical protein
LLRKTEGPTDGLHTYLPIKDKFTLGGQISPLVTKFKTVVTKNSSNQEGVRGCEIVDTLIRIAGYFIIFLEHFSATC